MSCISLNEMEPSFYKLVELWLYAGKNISLFIADQS